MHFTYFLAIVATFGLTQAQLPNLPSCSLNCFLSALQNDGCPSLTNFTCHCADPNLVGAITPCVQSACDLSDQSSVSNAVTSVCSSASVPISIPPVSATSTGSAGETTSTGSAAAGSGSESKTPSSTSASSSETGGAGGVGGTSATSGTSGVTSGASASTPTSTPTGTGTTTSGTTTGTTTTGASQATGAAGSVSVPFVGTGLFAVGVAALFAL